MSLFVIFLLLEFRPDDADYVPTLDLPVAADFFYLVVDRGASSFILGFVFIFYLRFDKIIYFNAWKSYK